MKYAAKFVLPLLVAASGNVLAQESLAPHVHGEALLQVVLDDQELAINLSSPAFNLLGFERAPENNEEQALIENLDTNMRDPQFWLELPAEANCSLSHVSLGQHVETKTQGEAQADDLRVLSEHRDLAFEYHFLCADPDRFDQARVKLFKHFPALTGLHAEVIGASQSLQELSAGNPILLMP